MPDPHWLILVIRSLGLAVIMNPLAVSGIVAFNWMDRSKQKRPDYYDSFRQAVACSAWCAFFYFTLSLVSKTIVDLIDLDFDSRYFTVSAVWLAWAPVTAGVAGYFWMRVLHRFSSFQPRRILGILLGAHLVQFVLVSLLERMLAW